ncbi:MAG: ArsR/SmtB family transcription factor [Candidatus Binatia bacterium]
MAPKGGAVPILREAGEPSEEELSRVFFALSDPVRRAILARIGDEPLLVSELAAPFAISLQAVSRHIQVLVRAGLVRQERTGRISRCSLVAGPIYAAAVWLNRYSKYWQQQFDVLARALEDIEQRRTSRSKARPPRAKRGAKRARRKKEVPR